MEILAMAIIVGTGPLFYAQLSLSTIITTKTTTTTTKFLPGIY